MTLFEYILQLRFYLLWKNVHHLDNKICLHPLIVQFETKRLEPLYA